MLIDCDKDRFIREVYENSEYKFLFHYPTVIDIGCNVGGFSFWMKDFAEIIYAIDIAEPNIQNLEKTLEVNKITKIKPYFFAIGGSTGMSAYKALGNPNNGAWRLEEPGNGMVMTYSLNDFMVKEKISYADLVKIDVEGGETAIIEAPDFPYKKIGTIIGETHGERSGGIKIKLEQYGYKWWGNEQYFIGRKV